MGQIDCSKKLKTSEVNVVDAEFDRITVPNGKTLNYALEQLEAIIPTSIQFKSVLEFGVVGDGFTNDRVAFQAAIDYCIQNDRALYVPAGIYIINTFEGNAQTPLRLDRLTQSGQSLYMFGDGKGKTIIREQDGCLDAGWASGNVSNAKFLRLLYCYMQTTTYQGGHYVFKGITFDKNNRSNTITPYDATGSIWEFESASILQFAGNQGMPSIKSVTIDDCEFIDKMGPSVNLSTSNVNIYNLVISNCYSLEHPTVINNPTKWGHREDFGLAIDSDNTVIENTTCLYAQIEPTQASSETRVRRYKMTDSKINVLEFTEVYNGDYSFIDINNMYVSDAITFRGMNVTVSNSIIKSIDSYHTPRSMKVVNSTILLNYDEANSPTVDGLYIRHHASFSWLAQADFVNCDIMIDAVSPTTVTGYAVKSGLTASDQAAPCQVTFTNCRFDERFYGIASTYSNGGDLTFNNCVLAGTVYAFSSGTFSDYISKLTINNCDFSKVTGTNLIITRPTLSVGGEFELNINGTYKASEWSYATSGSANINAYYKAKPKLIGSTYPTSGYWYLGDIVLNDFTSTTDVSGWVCTAEGTSGTWLSFGGTNLTKSYVDTALSGKQATLVSGTNIKTLNGSSILGSGNLSVAGLMGNSFAFTYAAPDTAFTFYPNSATLSSVTQITFGNNTGETVDNWLAQINTDCVIQIGYSSIISAVYTITSNTLATVDSPNDRRVLAVTPLVALGSIVADTEYTISFVNITSGSALGYTPEDVANKENTTLDTSTTKYPTNNLIKSYADSALGELTRSWTTINNSTTVIASNMNAGTLQGTATAVASAVTNTKTKQIRVNIGVTTPAVDGQCGYRQTVNLVSLGSGFRMFIGFGIDDSAYNSGAIQFYGLTTGTGLLTASSTITLESLTNLVGIGSDAADTNLQIFHNDGSGTCTKVNLGSNFPANRDSGSSLDNWYTLELHNEVGSTSITYRVINRTSGSVATGTISTNLPTALLFAQLYRTSGASANACSFSYSKMILRTVA